MNSEQKFVILISLIGIVGLISVGDLAFDRLQDDYVDEFAGLPNAPDYPPPEGCFDQAPRPPWPRNPPSSWANPEDYPAMGLKNDIETLVAFRVTVDVYGEVSDCEITQASGFDAFDTRVCALVSSRARFYPARDAGGNDVEGNYSNRIRWLIEDS